VTASPPPNPAVGAAGTGCLVAEIACARMHFGQYEHPCYAHMVELADTLL
jgi:hypothetical protein